MGHTGCTSAWFGCSYEEEPLARYSHSASRGHSKVSQQTSTSPFLLWEPLIGVSRRRESSWHLLVRIRPHLSLHIGSVLSGFGTSMHICQILHPWAHKLIQHSSLSVGACLKWIYDDANRLSEGQSWPLWPWVRTGPQREVQGSGPGHGWMDPLWRGPGPDARWTDSWGQTGSGPGLSHSQHHKQTTSGPIEMSFGPHIYYLLHLGTFFLFSSCSLCITNYCYLYLGISTFWRCEEGLVGQWWQKQVVWT